jgi:hypothetical protein
MTDTINKKNTDLINELEADLMDINVSDTIYQLKYAALNIKSEINDLLDKDDPDNDYAGCLLEHVLAITDTITLLHNFESKLTSHKLHLTRLQVQSN